MSIAELKDSITIITGEEAASLRGKYISRFIDTGSEHFQKYIATRKQFKDGLFYTGYLWDCFKHAEPINESELTSQALADQEVYVFGIYIALKKYG